MTTMHSREPLPERTFFSLVSGACLLALAAYFAYNHTGRTDASVATAPVSAPAAPTTGTVVR